MAACDSILEYVHSTCGCEGTPQQRQAGRARTRAGHTHHALTGVHMVFGYEHQLMHTGQMQAGGC